MNRFVLRPDRVAWLQTAGRTGRFSRMTLPAGTRLGSYEIVAPIGAGGMGAVYKAKDTRLDRTVASLNHPNIVDPCRD